MVLFQHSSGEIQGNHKTMKQDNQSPVSETRYVQNLYQHTQPDKQDSMVTGVKTRHITIQPLYYSFHILPHPNGIKTMAQGA
jgi:hypothetical protein